MGGNYIIGLLPSDFIVFDALVLTMILIVQFFNEFPEGPE